MLWQQHFGLQKKFEWRKAKRGEKKEQWWKRRIESDITNLKRNNNRLEKERRGETGEKGKRRIKELNVKYRVKKKGINLLIQELKQRLTAKKKEVKRYKQRISQFRQNQLFKSTKNRCTKNWTKKKKVTEVSEFWR